MTTASYWLKVASGLALAAVLSACGGGGSDTPVAEAAPAPAPAPAPTPVAVGANVLPIVLDRGTDQSAINSPFVTVTVCEPGTQNCVAIDHVLVDTGSVGLRVEAGALGSLNLPAVASAGGGALAECTLFASGFTWGAVRKADVRLAEQQASALSVQVMNDTASAYATVPTDCSDNGARLTPGGAKGILGVGFSVQDCGLACERSSLPGVYFGCAAGGGCTGVTVPTSTQVTHPVAALASADNNGLAIVLPDVPLGGVSSLSGSLILGISTRDNNQLGPVPIYTADAAGMFTTTYKGQTMKAFIDSGSNGIFFADPAIPVCSTGFYCPGAPLSLTATATGTNGASVGVPFVVENPASLAPGSVAGRLGGTVFLGQTFDWGLPFFFGRTVFVAISGRSTPAGVGPFWAF